MWHDVNAAIRFSPAPGTGKSREPGPVRILMTSPDPGPLAQRLEQRTHKPLRPGSNPGGPTKTATPLSPTRGGYPQGTVALISAENPLSWPAASTLVTT